jgi:hypothetical protein
MTQKEYCSGTAYLLAMTTGSDYNNEDIVTELIQQSTALLVGSTSKLCTASSRLLARSMAQYGFSQSQHNPGLLFAERFSNQSHASLFVANLRHVDGL